jgi:hypothetical protein
MMLHHHFIALRQLSRHRIAASRLVSAANFDVHVG